jgi:hypothetical protein
VRQSEDLAVLGEGTRSGPPAAPDQYSLGSSNRYRVEQSAAELGDLLTSIIDQHVKQVEHNIAAYFVMVPSKWNTIQIN